MRISLSLQCTSGNNTPVLFGLLAPSISTYFKRRPLQSSCPSNPLHPRLPSLLNPLTSLVLYSRLPCHTSIKLLPSNLYTIICLNLKTPITNIPLTSTLRLMWIYRQHLWWSSLLMHPSLQNPSWQSHSWHILLYLTMSYSTLQSILFSLWYSSRTSQSHLSHHYLITALPISELLYPRTPPLFYDYIAIDITTVPANNVAIPHAPLNSEQATNHIHKVRHVRIQRKLCN
jgi:hypothetical protein